jgi:hypothetical protein
MGAAPTVAPRPIEARRAAALAAIGGWTAVVPYLGRALGLEVDVPARVEVIDHVVPGAIVAAIGTGVALLARSRPVAGRLPALLGGGVCFLAGFWVLATHVPLVVDAVRGDESWGAALWHASTAPPIVALSMWLALEPGPQDDG